MGGMGIFELLVCKFDIFVVVIFICGGINFVLFFIFVEKVLLWIFYGVDDVVVDVKYSRWVVDVLKVLGYLVCYIEYLGVNYNSWDNVFVEFDFLSWLMSY